MPSCHCTYWHIKISLILAAHLELFLHLLPEAREDVRHVLQALLVGQVIYMQQAGAPLPHQLRLALQHSIRSAATSAL
jgi:hypothetical protein